VSGSKVVQPSVGTVPRKAGEKVVQSADAAGARLMASPALCRLGLESGGQLPTCVALHTDQRVAPSCPAGAQLSAAAGVEASGNKEKTVKMAGQQGVAVQQPYEGMDSRIEGTVLPTDLIAELSCPAVARVSGATGVTTSLSCPDDGLAASSVGWKVVSNKGKRKKKVG